MVTVRGSHRPGWAASRAPGRIPTFPPFLSAVLPLKSGGACVDNDPAAAAPWIASARMNTVSAAIVAVAEVPWIVRTR